MLIDLAGGLTEAKEASPFDRKLSAVKLETLCQNLKPDCLQASLPQRAAGPSAANPAPAFLVRFILSKAVIPVNPNLARVAFTVLNT